MIKTGTVFKFEKPTEPHYIQTRDGMSVKLQEEHIFTKVQDNLLDKLCQRCMFKLDNQIREYDCSSILNKLTEIK